MKRLILLTGLLLLGGESIAQSANTRSVSVTKSPDVTNEMKAYARTHGSYICDSWGQKSFQSDGTVTLAQAEKIDPTAMGFQIIDRSQIFLIEGTDKILIVKSSWVLDNEMKNAKK